MVVGILSMFIQIFINEKKHPQDSSEQNAIMDFVMRSIFLVFDAALACIIRKCIVATG
jgi:membrane protein insertase Oxa1/YidC/SpoIIIJ